MCNTYYRGIRLEIKIGGFNKFPYDGLECFPDISDLFGSEVLYCDIDVHRMATNDIVDCLGTGNLLANGQL